MKELVLFIAKQLAQSPDKIEVRESENEGVKELRIVAAEEDKGRLIGKQGKVIKAIRALAAAAAGKSGYKVSVDIES